MCVCVIISSWVAVNYMVTYLRHIDQLRDGVNVPPESDVEVPTGGLSSQASTEELSSGSQITPETPTTTTDTTDSRPAEMQMLVNQIELKADILVEFIAHHRGILNRTTSRLYV